MPVLEIRYIFREALYVTHMYIILTFIEIAAWQLHTCVTFILIIMTPTPLTSIAFPLSENPPLL